jgi:membrane protein YdbS with pleckstrin-like domain
VDTGELEQLETRTRRRLYRREDATLWVWICYGLAQAVITMLMAFDVIQTLTAAEVVTAVTLVIYVAVNELLVRPTRRPDAPGEP